MDFSAALKAKFIAGILAAAAIITAVSFSCSAEKAGDPSAAGSFYESANELHNDEFDLPTGERCYIILR